MRVRDRLRIPERWQRRSTRAMQILLVGMFFIGLERRDPGVIVNAGVAILVTEIPPILERDYEIPMDAGLTLWITSAVFVHALGTVGVPGGQLSFYQSLGWWDHLAHALSSSVVAAAGYATARAIDEHSSGVTLPPAFTFAFILLVTLAFGVAWEVLEFAVGQAAIAFGTGRVLTQYGLADTMLDLVFDTVGAVVVAVWGTAYLVDVVGALGDRLES